LSSNSFQYVSWFKDLFQKLGFTLSKDTAGLDFGCGVGQCVDQFRKAGYNMFGCDIDIPDNRDDRLKSYLESGIIRKIGSDPYHIPFEDDTFDFIYSNVVFEHVMDYPSTLAELHRILKRDGMSVHTMPGRWTFKENHIYVPLASVIKTYGWLYFWAWWGIRNEYQQGLSAAQTAEINYRYLHQQTNYLSRRKIRKYVTQYFNDCRFVEDPYFCVPPKLSGLSQRFPLLLKIYRIWFSETKMRVLIFRKKKC